MSVHETKQFLEVLGFDVRYLKESPEGLLFSGESPSGDNILIKVGKSIEARENGEWKPIYAFL